MHSIRLKMGRVWLANDEVRLRMGRMTDYLKKVKGLHINVSISPCDASNWSPSTP